MKKQEISVYSKDMVICDVIKQNKLELANTD